MKKKEFVAILAIMSVVSTSFLLLVTRKKSLNSILQ